MDLDTLTKKFIVNDEWLKDRLEAITTKLLEHCVIDKSGQVHVTDRNLTAKQSVMLVLAARKIASQLDTNISSCVTVSEIARSTGLRENQVRARGNDWITATFAESPKRGVFCALPHKIENFVDSLAKGGNGDED
jgi:hypothetical protein